MPQPFIIDAHEDIAYNVLTFGRDYTRAAEETRRIERETNSPNIAHNGNSLLGWPDYQRGRVAIVFGTLFVTPRRVREGDWDTQSYANFEEAHRLYSAQLDVYHKLTDRAPDKFRLVGSRADLETVIAHWQGPDASPHPVGIVPLMEGAEGVRAPSELEEWWERGVRIIGPAWAGTRYCGGTREPGPLTDDGRDLLNGMADIGFTLDLSHMDELAVRQALDLYPGPMIASHANAAALVRGYTGNRLLSDEVIHGLLDRDGIIGVVPFNRFLDFGWKKGERRDTITLTNLAAHVDYICQMAGDARHVGLGSDYDGGFGVESVPADVDTIADLQKLGSILTAKGYNDEDVAAILGENWLRHLRLHLPA
jgi:membrane dipeptidase